MREVSDHHGVVVNIDLQGAGAAEPKQAPTGPRPLANHTGRALAELGGVIAEPPRASTRIVPEPPSRADRVNAFVQETGIKLTPDKGRQLIWPLTAGGRSQLDIPRAFVSTPLGEAFLARLKAVSRDPVKHGEPASAMKELAQTSGPLAAMNGRPITYQFWSYGDAFLPSIDALLNAWDAAKQQVAAAPAHPDTDIYR